MAEPTYAEAMAALLRDGCDHADRLCLCKIGVSLIEKRTVAELWPDAVQQCGTQQETEEAQ